MAQTDGTHLCVACQWEGDQLGLGLAGSGALLWAQEGQGPVEVLSRWSLGKGPKAIALQWTWLGLRNTVVSSEQGHKPS